MSLNKTISSNNKNDVQIKFEYTDITSMVKNLNLLNGKYILLNEIKKNTKKGIYIIQNENNQKFMMKVKLKKFVSDCEIQTYKLIKKNKHPNILNITNLYISNYFFIVIYEFIEGCTMMETQYYHKYEKNINDIYNNIIIGLNHLHNYNIYHCDIKPDNIMIIKKKNNYVPIIIDFDLSYLVIPSINNINIESVNYNLINKKNNDIKAVALVFYYYIFNKHDDLYISANNVNDVLMENYDGKNMDLVNIIKYILNYDMTFNIDIKNILI
jgi:serine/threonine protein kinase